MPIFWIIHREPQVRAALARLAAADATAILAGPGDPQLADAPRPDVILMGLGDDFEAELQFAHRSAQRLAGARWILLPRRRDVDSARKLFDGIDRVVLAYPPDPHALRRHVRGPTRPAGGDPLPLSLLPARDALSDRFARWFADLEFPDLLRVLDPQLADIPVLIRGEPGTGRSLLARYIHTFSGTASGALLHAVCTEDSQPEDLLEAVATATRRLEAAPSHSSVWLEDVHRLPTATQRVVQGWIEFGRPAEMMTAGTQRWIGTAGTDAELDSGLRCALGVFAIDIPPVRERAGLIAPFAADTAHAWCTARGERPRRFGEDAIAVLEEYPWPGNVRELESAVVQTLLTSNANPVSADGLRHEGIALAPLAADEIGVLVEDDVPWVTATEEQGPDDAPPPEAARPEVETPPPVEASAVAVDDSGLPRLMGAIAHEVRNPLTTIRTFAALLPSDYQDRSFRDRFSALVGRGVDRIETVVRELARFSVLTAPQIEPVDTAVLLEELLAEQRDTIHGRHLVVLKELEKSQPLVLADPGQLRWSFELMLRKCLDLVPERGDVYIASRHHGAGLRGRPSLRVLVRFSGPQREGGHRSRPVSGVSPADHALEFAIAEAVVRTHRGALAIQAGEGDETVLVLDLPSPD